MRNSPKSDVVRIEKKVWPEYFEKLLTGEKNFEVRLGDWTCKPGDILVLKEWDPKTKEFTGRKLEKMVTYVRNSKDIKHWTDEEIEKYGLQIIALK